MMTERWNEVKARLLGLAENEGLIRWDTGAVDELTAPFPPGKGGAEVAYGYKVKGILIHLLVDAEGLPISAVSTPANGDERKQVEHLVETVKVKMGKPGRPPKKIKRISGDKGYDSQKLRAFLLKQRNYAADSKKEKCEPRRGRPVLMSAPRFLGHFHGFKKNSVVSLQSRSATGCQQTTLVIARKKDAFCGQTC